MCIVTIEVCVDNLDVVTLNAGSVRLSALFASSHFCRSWRSAMEGFVPIVEVDLGKGMYWSMPSALSAQLYKELVKPVVAKWELAYTWEWGIEGEAPSYNSYVIDVKTMTQRNMKTQRQRDIRVVWVQK